MTRASLANKAARAARLTAEASRLFSEMAEELMDENGNLSHDQEAPAVPEVVRVRAKRALAKAGIHR